MKTLRNTILFMLTAVLVSCSGLGRMQKKISEVKIQPTPNPLEAHGNMVSLNLKGDFPEKYFDKKTTLTVTPKLKNSDAEYRFKSIVLQGENVAGNNKQISYVTGDNFSYTDVIPYIDGMENGDLVLDIEGKRGTKNKKFDPLKIGVGTIITPLSVDQDMRVLVAPDNFRRITQHKKTVEINYAVNSAAIRGKELRDQDVKDFKAFAKSVRDTNNIIVKYIEVEAYASPEGELRMNDKLAKQRVTSSKREIRKILRRNKINDKADDFYTEVAKGEDWIGFKSKLEASNIEDKNLILRILTMESDLVKREKEIRNLSKTYTEIADKILPELRRATVVAGYEIIGKDDELIRKMAKENPIDLNIEELLYAATLFNDLETKKSLYMLAEKQFVADPRGSNNVGQILFLEGHTEEAKGKFEKSLEIKENPHAHNNLGVVYHVMGDLDKANEEYKKAVSIGKDVKYNMGVMSIQNGNYGSAIKSFGREVTFNVALAHHLSEDQDQSMAVLKKLRTIGESIKWYYLQAIVSAKQNDEEGMLKALKSVFIINPSWKEKTKNDPAFYSFWNNTNFQNAVK